MTQETEMFYALLSQDYEISSDLCEYPEEEQLYYPKKFESIFHEVFKLDNSSKKCDYLRNPPPIEKKYPFKVVYDKNYLKFKFIIKGINPKFLNQKKLREKKVIENKDNTKKGRKRKENQDHQRKKIKHESFSYIQNEMNKLLKKGGISLYFEKIPYVFTSDVTRSRNKGLLNMTLMQIMKDENILYKRYFDGDKELDKDKCNQYELYERNFKQNSKIIEIFGKNKNLELEKFLNTKYGELFDQYFNSEDFRNSIIIMFQKGKDYRYIGRYIYLCKTWKEFFS